MIRLASLFAALAFLLAGIARAAGPEDSDGLPAWYVSASGEQQGPFSIDTLVAMARDRAINKGTRAWTGGMAEWRPIGEIAALGRVIAAIDAAAGRPASEPEPEPLPPPRREPGPSPLPPGPSDTNAVWYYAVGPRVIGPYTLMQLCDLAAEGTVKPKTKVYHPDRGWQESRDYSELHSCLR